MRHWRVGLLLSVVIVLSVGCGAPSSLPSGTTNTPFQPTATATSTLVVKLSPRVTVTRLFVIAATPIEPSLNNDNVVNGTPIPTPVDPTLQKVIAQAKQDLTRRLAVDANQIDLVQVQSVVWPNGSLGCPRPGVRYPQVELDGWLIRFRAGGRLYDYHSAGNGAPFLCETGK